MSTNAFDKDCGAQNTTRYKTTEDIGEWQVSSSSFACLLMLKYLYVLGDPFAVNEIRFSGSWETYVD
jgi:hypothetical protein